MVKGLSSIYVLKPANASAAYGLNRISLLSDKTFSLILAETLHPRVAIRHPLNGYEYEMATHALALFAVHCEWERPLAQGWQVVP